ncbi:MAG: hypothetical protein N2508_10700 [Anaerolineae bacterium]|nr:hypothetical protein [Anaerolineae bacterium]
METITYPYSKSKLALPVGVLSFFLACLMMYVAAGSVASLFNPSQAQGLEDSASPLLTFLGLCGMGWLFLFLGIWNIYISQVPMEAVLTPDAFSYGRRGRLTTIPLAEITRVTGRKEWWYNTPDFSVTIEGAHKQRIFFRKTPLDKYTGGFDYRAILRDLLARLPATAQVDPRVHKFVETGRY